MDNSGKDSHDLLLSRAFETQIATSEEGAFLYALAYIAGVIVLNESFFLVVLTLQ